MRQTPFTKNPIENGRKGGLSTFKKLGSKFFSKIGEKGRKLLLKKLKNGTE